jgi:alpha-amylase
MNTLRFVFCLHNHQPVGNFDSVIAEIYDLAYKPFLDVVERYPEFRFSLHTSGCLLEWLESHRPEYLERLHTLVQTGQAELLTGAMYEPILPVWPDDMIRVQIARQNEYTAKRFGVKPRAFWLPERVWEPQLAGVLHDCGVRHVPLDDLFFAGAGLIDDEMLGYYTTEHLGKSVNLFPVPQKLRYTIPFAEPVETIEYLRHHAKRATGLVATYGDDGEKFGSWPETHAHVYERGWLVRFIEAVLAESDWIKPSHFEEVANDLPPAGRVYLPTGSYREMTEWALPAESSVQFGELWHQVENDPSRSAERGLVKGGYWRSFFTKYPEANRMHKTVLYFAQRILSDGPRAPEAALTHALRAQCNCPYWHGVFGGLYLPHLRSAVYEQLGRARALVPPRQAGIHTADHDGDGIDDVMIEHPDFDLHLAPARGGGLELILQHDPPFNWGCTLTRREEAYHRKLNSTASRVTGAGAKSIHDVVKVKEPGLEQYLVYDHHERASLLDYVIRPDATLEEFLHDRIARYVDLANSRYAIKSVQGNRVTLSCLKTADLQAEGAVNVQKTIEPGADGSAFTIEYQVEVLGALRGAFGVEWNLTALAPTGPDRWIEIDGKSAGDPNGTGERSNVRSFALADRWGKKAIRITGNRAFDLWWFGLHTVSLSEAGFEKVYQQTVFMPHFELSSSLQFTFTVELLKYPFAT